MIYRVRQFLQGLNAKINSEDVAFLSQYLSKQEKELFFSLSVSEQRHSLNVAYGCHSEMPYNNSLIRAAILHDIGKIGTNLTLIKKALVVIALEINIEEKLLPAFLKKSIYYKLNHAKIGYELLREIIKDEKLLLLVKHHHTPENIDYPEMKILVHYDNIN